MLRPSGFVDAFLAEQAVAGAELATGSRSPPVQGRRTGSRSRPDGDGPSGGLVGADGVNGVCAGTLGLGGNQAVGVALEGMPWEKLDGGYRGCAVLELELVPGGYGWVFPKATTPTSGSAAGNGRTRAPRFPPAGAMRGTRSRGGRPGERPRLSPAAAFAALDARARPDGRDRGRRRPGRPGLRRRNVRGLPLGEARGRRRARPPGRPGSGLEPYGERLTRQLGTHLWASWGVKAALDRFPRTTFADRAYPHRLAHRGEARARRDRRRRRGARPRPSAAQGPHPRPCRGGPRRRLQTGVILVEDPCRLPADHARRRDAGRHRAAARSALRRDRPLDRHRLAGRG